MTSAIVGTQPTHTSTAAITSASLSIAYAQASPVQNTSGGFPRSAPPARTPRLYTTIDKASLYSMLAPGARHAPRQSSRRRGQRAEEARRDPCTSLPQRQRPVAGGPGVPLRRCSASASLPRPPRAACGGVRANSARPALRIPNQKKPAEPASVPARRIAPAAVRYTTAQNTELSPARGEEGRAPSRRAASCRGRPTKDKDKSSAALTRRATLVIPSASLTIFYSLLDATGRRRVRQQAFRAGKAGAALARHAGSCRLVGRSENRGGHLASVSG